MENIKKGMNDKGYVGMILSLAVGMVALTGAMLAVGNNYTGTIRVKNAQNDIHTIGNLAGLGNEYYTNVGSSPTISGLVSQGYLSSSAPGVSTSCNGGNGCFTTTSGTVVTFAPGTGGGFITNVTLPGSYTSSTHNLVPMFQNALQGSTISGNTLSWPEPTPAIQNMLSQVQWGKINAGTNGSTQSANGNLNMQGYIQTNGNPIYSGPISSGSINTNGQPISGPGRQWLNYSPPSLTQVLGVYFVIDSGSPEVIWSQPCNGYGCGTWGWWSAGSVVNGSSSTNVWWNTTYGPDNLIPKTWTTPHPVQSVLY